MLNISGYDLPEIAQEDTETVTLRGVRLADGARVRARVLRNPRPTADERAAWKAGLDRLRVVRGAGAERLLELVPFGAAEAIVVEDDGGQPLASLLAGGALAIDRVVDIAIGVTAALSALHAAGLVHGRVCVGAVWVGPLGDAVTLGDAALDPCYRAPEQWESVHGGVDARTDLYAVGVLMHHLLAGKPPFTSDDPADLAHAHAARKPPDPRVVRPETPALIAAIGQRLLAKAKAERYQTAYGLTFDLQALRDARQAGRSTDDVVLGAADRAAVFALPTRLYGREREVQTLIDAFDRARWGHCDPFLLRGAPGIGKSALAAELRAEVEREHGTFVAGKFDQYKRNVPYSAVAQAFTALVHQLSNGPPSQVAHWRQRITAALGANARVLIDIIPDVELLTGPLPLAPPLGPVESRHRFNSVIREFVRLFATELHPLVILLDDLQWADAASLSLVTTLAQDATLNHLLLLGAYRDSKAGEAQLFVSALEELRAAGIRVGELDIGPITLSDTTAIVADTLKLAAPDCAELALVVSAKTGGNPFFVRQFLRALHDDALILFDTTSGRWQWDLHKVRARDYSDNVTSLMAARLLRLAPDARAALGVASCVGAVFALPIVAAALELPVDRVAAALGTAVDDALIEPVTGGRYRFVHDRVQQSAYALIDDAERAHLRRRIGQVMRRMLSAAELEEALFEVVTNLIAGMDGITEPDERAELVRLCLAAGRRARAAMAYEDARSVLQAGLSAIDGEAAEREHGFALRSELFECAYLTSRFDEADALFVRLVRDAAGVVERAHIYNTKILIDTSQGRGDDAVRLGIEAVREFGVFMPMRPGMASVLWELVRVKLALRGRRGDTLLGLPRMTDPVRTAAIGLLLRIGPAAYFNNPEALILSALKIVRLSLSHGNTAGSSFGYVIYGMVIGAKLGDAAGAQQFGRLAVALSDRLDAADIRAKVHFIFGSFINFWSAPYRTTLRIIADAFPLAVEAGDPQYAGYCHNGTIFQQLAFGVALDGVVTLSEGYQPFIVQANDTFSVDSHALMRQRARALRGPAGAGARLDGPGFEESAWLQKVRASGNLTTLGYYQVSKLQLALLFRDLDTARRIGEEGYANREAVLSQIHSAELHLYFGLVLCAVLRDRTAATVARRKTLAACRRVLARHARSAPANFEPWHLLLEAEARSGIGDAGLSQYDRAIDSARSHGQPNLHGLAAELAARSQLAAGRRTVAQSYLRDALAAYEAWQAMAKVHQLVQEFADLLPEQALAISVPPALPGRRVTAAIGLEAALGAAHALTNETDLDELLERLLRIAIEGAGAQTGQVVLQRDAGLFVEAMADAERDGVLMAHRPLAEATAMCIPVVQTVLRRRAPIVIADALEDPQFGMVPDVRSRQPRSIACMPIATKDRLLGALYVENNLRPAAFSPDQVRLLSLMASEVAVGVERARLSGVARASHDALGAAMRRVELLEKSKAHLGKFVPQSVQRLIDANPDAPALEKRERDVTILFLDIEGYTRLTEALSRERLDWLVRTYFSRFLDIVHAHCGDINETAGDGLMIIFQDDDTAAHASNAARAASEIGRATQVLNASLAAQFEALAVNIGINSGVALVGATRLQGSAEARFTFTATGAITNVAARLGAFATGGAVVVSEATAARLGSAFELEALGPQRLKNVSEPVLPYRLLDRGAVDQALESFAGPPQERLHPLGGPGEARTGGANPQPAGETVAGAAGWKERT